MALLDRRRRYGKKAETYIKRDWLKFTITGNSGTVVFKQVGTNDLLTKIAYSVDEGHTWVESDGQSTLITPILGKGDSVYWKGLGSFAKNVNNYHCFSLNAKCKVSGNIMSLVFWDDFESKTSLTSSYQLACVFRGIQYYRIDASELLLPATSLTSMCYYYMFNNSLVTKAPQTLPATTLATSCYAAMFSTCTELTTVPTLPATTLAANCYASMFSGCAKLTAAPPSLPATTLQPGCYSCMFNGCTALTTVPTLPATTLVQSCYYYMFQNCKSLKYIKAMFKDMSASNCTTNWVNGVAASGTFVKNRAATWNVTGVHGIPSGWTVQTASS